jgi:hypothetical protein
VKGGSGICLESGHLLNQAHSGRGFEKNQKPKTIPSGSEDAVARLIEPHKKEYLAMVDLALDKMVWELIVGWESRAGCGGVLSVEIRITVSLE